MDLPDFTNSRPVPQNLEAEQALLGSILLDNSALNVALETVTADDFFRWAHAEIFRKMQAIADRNRAPVDSRLPRTGTVRGKNGGGGIDLITLQEILGVDGALEKVGGVAYLSALTDGVPIGSAASVTEYARIVRDKSVLRRIIAAANNVAARAMQGADDSSELLSLAVEQFLDIDAAQLTDSPLRTYRQAATDLLAKLDARKTQRVVTGISTLDEITGGFLGGELIVFTAETGVGKTIFAAQTRRKACSDGLRGLFVSAEMTGEHLVSREMAVEGHVPAWKLRQPERLDGDEWRALATAAQHQCDKCRILDGEVSIARTKAAARRMKAEGGLDLVIIDYDELVDAPGKGEMEQQAAVATGAKRLARSLDVPVILISQLRKLLTGEDRRRPSISRLYGSGAKVKHASIIIYVNREYVQTLSGSETDAELVVLKNRDGKIGKVKAYFNVREMRFGAIEKGAP